MIMKINNQILNSISGGESEFKLLEKREKILRAMDKRDKIVEELQSKCLKAKERGDTAAKDYYLDRLESLYETDLSYIYLLFIIDSELYYSID